MGKKNSLNENDFVRGKKKTQGLYCGPRCIKNKSELRKKKVKEKKTTEKGIEESINYPIYYISQYIRGRKLVWHKAESVSRKW